MKSNSRTIVIRILGIASALLMIPAASLLHAQGRVSEVTIPEGGVDYTGFPTISVNAIVSDDTRSRVAGLTEADFALREDGREMPFTLSEVEAGIQVVFVLDASASSRNAGSSGYARLEEGKQLIYSFAEGQMAEGLDQIAVLAPGPEGTPQRAAPLPDEPADFTSFKNTVRDGTYLYELPQGVGTTPLNDLVSTALGMLEGAESSLHKAVVVISDGVDVISDREVADSVNTANQLHVPIYTVIYGPTNNWGGRAESNMKRLSLDTHGEHFRLSAEGRKPDPVAEVIRDAVAPLYDNLVSQRSQYRLTWDSAIFTPGSHELALAAGGKSTKTGISLDIRPPEVTIVQPAAGSDITRSTDDPRVSAEDIEPRTHPIVFEIAWPDGFPRGIETVDLLVDGVAAMDTCAPPCEQITWNIAALPAGSHSIRVRVRDQQGMQAESDEVPLTIMIIVPTPTPEPTPTPTPTCEEMYSGVTRISRCSPQVFGYVAIGVAFLALVLAVVVLRRRPQMVSAVVSKVKDATQPFFPGRAKVSAPREVRATLIVLEGDDQHIVPIELTSDNTRVGRDEELAQVTLANRSVSRLHARITVEQDQSGEERFMLYDEGSTSGTYVNFDQVGINGQQLQDDDMINFGQVRCQIKIKAKAPAHDATIAMAPIHPGTVADTMIAKRGEDEFATAPYEPIQPPQPEPGLDETQPFAAQAPIQPAAPPPPEPEDEDGISTEPYVPMDFGDE